jgi:DNA repair protein RadA/Sms
MRYACSVCRGEFFEFRVTCPCCGAWNTLRRWTAPRDGTSARSLPEIEVLPDVRRPSCLPELDLLLGGGFVPGSSTLLAGPPGAGKSTLAFEILRRMEGVSLYVSGEESVAQLKMRAERLGLRSPGVFLLFETCVERILPQAAQTGAAILVIDSVQTISSDRSGSLPGTPTQLRECVALLRRAAQECGTILILVGQVTKGGALAGPRTVEHAVDVVLRLEAGEKAGCRVLTAPKNRFGATEGACAFVLGPRGVVGGDSDA